MCVMRCSRVTGCSLHVLTAVFFKVPFFMMNVECGTRSSLPIVIDSASCVESDSDLMDCCVVVMDRCCHQSYHHKAL